MRSVTGERTVPKLKKSNYGTVVAPGLWFKSAWVSMKWGLDTARTSDKRFLLQKDMMAVVCVDATGDPKKDR